VDAAILRAAVDLLARVGPAGTTINAVARRSGVARASIYLRYPGRDALLDAAMRSAIGREPYPLTGDLAADLRSGAEQARAILASPTFQKVLPMLVAHMLGRGRSQEPLTFDAMFPNRRRLAEAYRVDAAANGLRTDIEPDVPVDLILGAMLIHLLATGRAPSAAFTRHVPDLVLDGLRPPG
jgi:AcrR family transcriptional regulator